MKEIIHKWPHGTEFPSVGDHSAEEVRELFHSSSFEGTMRIKRLATDLFVIEEVGKYPKMVGTQYDLLAMLEAMPISPKAERRPILERTPPVEKVRAQQAAVADILADI